MIYENDIVLKIQLNELSNGSIMSIANDLGCPIEYPKMDFNISGKRDNSIVQEENNRKFDNYMGSIIEQLVNKGYGVNQQDVKEENRG